MPKTSHYLGIDYGDNKIGLAIADAETRIAFVYGIIESKDFFDRIIEIVEKENIETVVIGMPFYLHDEKNAQKIKEVGKKTKDMAKIKVEFHEEMFSTKMAGDNLREKGIKNVESKDDAEAARIILQSWLDSSAHNT